MAEIKGEIVNFFSKTWLWFLYIILGLMLKFSYNIISGKKITFMAAVASCACSIALGALGSIWCISTGRESIGTWFVPAITLLADKILTAAFSIDYNKTAQDILKYFIKK